MNITKKTDAFIFYREASDDIKLQISNGVFYNYSKEEVWFHIPNVATYYIKDREIYVEEHSGDKNTIKVYLLGSALGVLLIINNIIAIHGATIILSDKGIIISGDSGSGKSTLTSGLIESGNKFISDDISRLDMNDNDEFLINPAYSQRKLCRDSIIELGYELDKCTLFDEVRDKYLVESKEKFIYENVKLNAIFEINIGDENQREVTIKEVEGYEKLKVILKNIFRVEIAYKIGFSKDYFKKILDVANGVKVYKIFRPKDKFTVDEQIYKVIKTLEFI